MLIAGSVSANIITNDIVDITSAVGDEKSIDFSMTGAEKDHFTFYIDLFNYPADFVVSTTFGGASPNQYSQIAMANGFQALLAGGTDVKAQAIWAGTGMLMGETSFFGATTDPNGWKNSTGYVGLRYRSYASYYYGWAEFEFVSTEAEKSVTLTRYAYETIANTTIITPAAIPEPATFLLFGLGGMGAWLFRRNKLKSKEEMDD